MFNLKPSTHLSGRLVAHIEHCLIKSQALIEQCLINSDSTLEFWTPLVAILWAHPHPAHTMGRRSDHSRDELQELIVNATLLLVSEHGAERVTARKIAEAVGYTPGMLYSVFINLQDIFLHVNQIGLKTLYEKCDHAIKQSPTPDAAIKHMGLAYLTFAAEHTHQFDLMFARIETQPEKTAQILTHQIHALFDLVETQLQLLAPTATDTQLTLAARALWSGVHGVAALRLSNQLYLNEINADREIVDLLVNNFLFSWQQSMVGDISPHITKL